MSNELEPPEAAKPPLIWWECLHCEETQATEAATTPRNCKCGRHSDFRLSQPPLNDADSPLYLRALFGLNKADGRHAIAEHLLRKHHFKTIHDEHGASLIWVYDAGVYRQKGSEKIELEVEKLLGSLSSLQTVREIKAKIARRSFVAREALQQTDPYLVCVKNGILDLRTKELKPHSPELIFLNRIPHDYKPEADCPKFKAFLDVVIDEDGKALEEYIGFMLFGEYKYKRAGLFLGPTDTGKTTLLKTLTAFLGEENVSGESLQNLISNSFAAHNLIGKSANFYDDLTTQEFYDPANFKIAVGGGYLRVERKFEQSFPHKNRAKLLFATNEVALPKKCPGDSYYGRWLVWLLLQQFKEGDPATNKGLVAELTNPEEMSGLLNLAVAGFQRLEAQQAFSYSKSPEDVRLLMHESGDVISAFSLNCLEADPEGVIPKEEMFAVFKAWCAREKRAPTSKDALGKRLSLTQPFIQDAPGGRLFNTVKQRCWVGAAFTGYARSTFEENISIIRGIIPSHRYVKSKDVSGVSPLSTFNKTDTADTPFSESAKVIKPLPPVVAELSVAKRKFKEIAGCNDWVSEADAKAALPEQLLDKWLAEGDLFRQTRAGVRGYALVCGAWRGE